MMREARCFVALTLPQAIREGWAARLARAGQVLAPGRGAPRVVPVAQMHLTLAFLGDVAAPTVAALQPVLDELAPLAAPELRVHGVGAFPSAQRPRVLWAGVDGELERLRELHAAVNVRLERMGLPVERRPFRPHVTLARVRDEAPGVALLEALRALLPGTSDATFRADELVLFESERRPEGGLHHPRHRVRLADPIGG